MNLTDYMQHAGLSQAALADLVGVSQPMVSHWLTARKAITPERAKQIEQVTGGVVQRHELRPDIFDAPAVVGVPMSTVCQAAPAVSPCNQEGEACNAS